MAEQSIFHGVVKGETAYTQLLCNLLKRDEEFLVAFLHCFKLRELKVGKDDVHAEVHLGDYGRADIRIMTETACVIVEIKTEIGRGLEDSQLLDEKSEAGYLSYLRAQRAEGKDCHFWFLIPAASYHAPRVESMIKAYRENFGRQDIKGDVLFWEDIVDLLGRIKTSNDRPYRKDFKMLLEERYGPIVFDDQEINLLFDSSFSVGTFIKYVKLLDDFRKQLDPQRTFKLDIHNEEFGFFWEKKGSATFWFGFWPKYWKESPNILFGVANASAAIEGAFTASLYEVFGQSALSFPDEPRWSLGYIPRKELIGSGAFERNKRKLRTVWSALVAAGI